MMKWIFKTTRHLFFTGKGGVGKTSLACAVAVALADKGNKVLLVSTDPASNLDEVLGVRLKSTATRVPGVPGLFALNINPEEAAYAYRERLIKPHRGKLPAAVLRNMEEQLSGACTTEIAAFDEFSKLLGDPRGVRGYDHIIFDTAPTGHTLRLMKLPSAWSGFIETNTTGTSCLGPLAGLQKQSRIYAGAVKTLADGKQTTLVLVTRAQNAAIKEAARTSHELRELGVKNQRLIINGIFSAGAGKDRIAVALEKRGTSALVVMRKFLASLPVSYVPLKAHNLLGIPALREMLVEPETQSGKCFSQSPQSSLSFRRSSLSSASSANSAKADAYATQIPQILPADGLESLGKIVDDLARAGRGVIMTMGKGGVGKTTIAAAIAVELARRGFPVTLSTTDPAAHVSAAVGRVKGVKVSRIDPAKETEAYVQYVLKTSGKGLDSHGLALLEEDLRSPCTEEIAVFRAFARTVNEGKAGFVVLDTAPTGHTLLLLDSTEAYHREVSRHASDMPEDVRKLLPRLRNPKYTKVLLVCLPEATPVHEAAQLQADLKRAGIKPFAWIINQSFAKTDTNNPLLVARGSNEERYIREVTGKLARRTVLVPWVAEEPVRCKGLRQLMEEE